MTMEEQHDDKGKGLACNNHNMCKPINRKMWGGVTHVIIIACSSLAFVFMHAVPNFSCHHHCLPYEDFVGQRHSTGENEAGSCKNEGKYVPVPIVKV